MIRAACHCTAVRLEIEPAPKWVLDCNCTICRRYGALWAYYKPDQVNIVQGADATDTYAWNERVLAFHRCKTCGCLVYMMGLDVDPPRLYGINARMIPTLDPASVPLRQIDNGHSGFFWTKSDAPVMAGRQPKMAPPGPDDWR